ncbi:hypothetical protein GQ55_3G409900 [Panicum hallii var. hallii]|uniref:Uncharacterized protein n=1 Tax=Panicum hallii var. hallii TaxID=1504633 RepID=A0A2T7EH46_9POAL|nr:hypothetical protein GQ55_3G409900 [Panicum hallii var. hallii]
MCAAGCSSAKTGDLDILPPLPGPDELQRNERRILLGWRPSVITGREARCGYLTEGWRLQGMGLTACVWTDNGAPEGCGCVARRFQRTSCISPADGQRNDEEEV